MEELQKLYDVLVRDGKYTKSFEEFQTKWAQDEQYKNKVYDVVSRDGLYTKDRNSFFQKYSGNVSAEKPVAPVKKKFALDSSSEVGSSELPKSTKPLSDMPTLDQQGLEQAMAKRQSVPTDMSGTPMLNTEAEKTVKPILQKIQKENQQLASEKKKYGDVFDKQLNIKPRVEESQYLKDRLATVDTELISKGEGFVVPELKYQFGDLGFEFEEARAGRDYVKAIAPNGKTIEISLDNFTDKESLNQSKVLQDFIKNNTPAKGLFVLEKTMREQDKKFNSQKQVDDSIKVISDEVNNLNSKQKQFLAKKSLFEKELEKLGPNANPQALALLEQQRVALNEEMKSILQEEENVKQKGKKLDAAVGKYLIAKAKQGTWLGGIVNSILGGIGSTSSGETNLLTDIVTEIAPTGYGMNPKELKSISKEISTKIGIKGPSENQTIDQWEKTLTEDQLDAWEDEVDDYIKKGLKSKTLPLIRIGAKQIFGDTETTQQWENLNKEGFWGGAILGLSESLPAMIGGAGPAGFAQRTAQMYAQVSDGLAEEMEQDPDFKDVSENEKLAITLPIGIVGAVLENVGLKNIKGSQGLINNIALKALGKSGRGVTAKTFKELVENEVDNAIAKGALTITAAGAAEFETGAAQELAETGFKELYNEIKDKKMFDTPESITDLMENVVVSGAQEAIGGFVLGVPTAVSTAFTEKGFLKMDDVTFDTFANMANDEKMQSAYITGLKEKITRGELSTAEAKDQLNNYRNSVGLFRQLPDGLSTQQKKEAMNLLKEKKDLENYVEGKDAALVVKQKNRITEINDSLTKLSETDAVQEQSTTEIPVQSETGISETVAEGISEPKPEIITEQGTQEEVTVPQTKTISLSESIDIEDDSNRKGIIPISELDDFIGEDRIGEAQTETSRENIDKLKEDISKNGFKEPIVLIYDKFSNGGEASIVEGNHRIIAAKELGFTEIPIRIEKGTLRSNEERVSENMFPLKRKKIGTIDDRFGVSADKLGLNIRQPSQSDFIINQKTEQATQAEVTQPQTIIEEQITEPQAMSEVNVSQQLNEQELPGYDRAISEVEGIIEKSQKRRVSEDKIADNVMSYVMGSKVYENATDIQREALVRDVRKRFGLKEKAAPSVAKLFGKLKDVRKVIMTEKAALEKQITDQAKGGRYAAKAINEATKSLIQEVKDLRKTGKINKIQEQSILNRLSNTNVLSEKATKKFIDYATKVYNNADYANKISEAKGLRSSIKKLSKDKEKNANLRVVAAKFGKIDPSLVDDIDAYNNMASKIKEATKGSSIRLQDVKFAETVNIQDAVDYTTEALKQQEQKIREEMIAELQDLMGVDASEFTAEEMLALLEPEAKTNEYNEGIVRATIKKAFDVYSTMISESIKSGKDVFTDEDVEYTKSQKELINKFMNMDTNNMSVKDSLASVDSLINFLTNQSTAKMEAVVRKYTGQQNAAKIRKEGIYALPLKKLGFERFGRYLGEQTTNLNILFEKMFVGFNRANKVKDAMGLNDLINGKSKAQRQVNTIVSNYVADFYNKKANNQKFNTLYNNIERGMTSFVSRNIIGTEAEMQAEFDRRKKLVSESIEALSVGNDQERKKGLVYQEVYDKILDDSTNIQEVQSKVDPTNLEAVDFWIKEWDNKFEELSDTALNIYNKVLDKDLNYTPDRFTKMNYSGGSVDLANTASAFITNTNGSLYQKETGVLMEATRPSVLPKNEDSNETESYIDLSFDTNNSNSMYDALVDINTAGPIKQVDSFIKTSDFRKIFGKDSDIIAGGGNSPGRVQQYIQNVRNKNPYSNDEFAKAMRSLNKIATLGVSQALAGPTQPLKQVVPVALNTLMNTKGNIDFSAMSNKDFMNWIKESGYAISNRGVESQADVDSINKMIEQAAESKGAKAVKLLEDANKRWLKIFLVKPDVWIAMSSWKSYYEQSLREQGINTKDIDYSTHELNKKAADYAQGMVDRQQNISDTDMSGTLFSNRNPYAQTMVKIFMPFASFRMNQASRLGSDLRVLSNWDISTAEDRKIAARSLAGYAVEMAAFRTISAGIGIGIASMTASLMGKGDDEEEKEKRRESLAKGAVTSTLIDIVSPIPVLDRLVQNNSALIIENIQKAFGVEDKDIKNIYDSRKINFVDALGTFGIASKRIEEIWDLIALSATGEYKDDFKKTRQISEENRDALSKLIAPVVISNLTGLASPEISGVSRNAMRIAKKKSPTPEEIKEMRDKVDSIQKIIDEATSPQEIESAEEMLNRVKYPERYAAEKEQIKNMKDDLLIDEETGFQYENQTDLKRYNRELWERNFGEGSEWYELNKPKKEAEKLFRAEERAAKDEEFGYTPKKRRKNSDGSYKKSSSRRGFSSSSSGSNSSSSESSTRYDSRGVKTTTTRSSNRRGFNN